MTGTRLAVVKQALIDRLRLEFASTDGMERLQVEYSPPGRVERECLYLGAARFSRTHPGLAADEEALSVAVHIYVRFLGGTQQETDARAAEIGAVLEELLEGDPAMTGVPGVMVARVESGELGGGIDDDAYVSELSYILEIRAALG